jgi:hypothetical protein
MASAKIEQENQVALGYQPAPQRDPKIVAACEETKL